MSLQSVQKSISSVSVDQQMHWCMVVVRNRRQLDSRVCKGAMGSYPYLSKCVDPDIAWTDLDALCNVISSLGHN